MTITSIGRYSVLSRLGGGGFGEVYLAEDPAIRRKVAIKIFRPKDENLVAFATSSDTEGLQLLRERFLNEARILSTLEDAQYIINILDYGELPDGAPYYVMPFLPRSLADELGRDISDPRTISELPEAQRPRALSLKRTLVVAEQLLAGLAVAHSKGLVHRDIKPPNIMLTDSGEVRIADFGIAKAPDLAQSTVTNMAMGSRNYMAPEQLESAKHVDARADIYAAGRVIYRALTGRLPSGRFVDPHIAVPAFGQDRSEILVAAISEDVKSRPANAGEMLSLWVKARTGPDPGADHESGTWVEGGVPRIRAEHRKIQTDIATQIASSGFISESEMKKLRAMAVLVDLDDRALDMLIYKTIQADGALSNKSKLAELIRKDAAAGSIGRKQPWVAYLPAAEAVGWDSSQVRKITTALIDEAARGARNKQAPGEPDKVQHSFVAPPRISGLPDLRSLAWPLLLTFILLGLGWGIYSWRDAQIRHEEVQRIAEQNARDEALAWEATKRKDSLEGYLEYLDRWPNGANAQIAEERKNRIELEIAEREKEPIREIQRDLNALGYQVPESGVAELRTIEAIKRFEQEQQMEITGKPDEVVGRRLKTVIQQRAEAQAVQLEQQALEIKQAEELQMLQTQRLAEAAEHAEAQRVADAKRAEEQALARNGGIVAMANGLLRDTRSGLIWTQSDNGQDIKWQDAVAYCKGLNMRLPSIDELAALYKRPGIAGTPCQGSTCMVPPPLKLTSTWFWSATNADSSSAWGMYFNRDGRNAAGHGISRHKRALCVRSG